MDILNNWSGFFALVAAIVSIASLCFGIWQYKKTQKQRLQEMQDELEILESFFKLSFQTLIRHSFMVQNFSF